MASTGEVGCLGKDFDEAFLKALNSVGFSFPIKSVLISSGTIESKAELLDTCRRFIKLDVKLYATKGTANFLKTHKVPVEMLYWPLKGGSPNAAEYIKSGKIDLVINLPKNYQEEELTNDYMIRRTAVDFKVPLITNRQIAMRLAEALSSKNYDDLGIVSWNEYH